MIGIHLSKSRVVRFSNVIFVLLTEEYCLTPQQCCPIDIHPNTAQTCKACNREIFCGTGDLLGGKLAELMPLFCLYPRLRFLIFPKL